MKQKHPECESCTCGWVSVEWSDRGGYYDPDDPESIVDVVMACCLDHSYDRTNTGIPHGMDDDLHNKLAPAVDSWFRNHPPEWFKETVWLKEEAEREDLRQTLLAALR